MEEVPAVDRSAAPVSQKRELWCAYNTVQQWLESQRASEWVLRQVQERWRALGDKRVRLTERLRALSGNRSWNLAKLVEVDRWNPVRQGRRQHGVAAWLLEFIAVLHPDALLEVERTLGPVETAPETELEDDLSAGLAAIDPDLGGEELRAALVGHVVLKRRVRMITSSPPKTDTPHDDPGGVSDDGEGLRVANPAELDVSTTPLLDQIAAIPARDAFWDTIEAFVAHVRALASDAYRRRERDADISRRRDLARELTDALSRVWSAHEDVVRWLVLAQPSVPEAIEPTSHPSLAATIGSLDDALRAFSEVRATSATSELHERELFEERRSRADDVRAQVGALADALQGAASAVADDHVAEQSAGPAAAEAGPRVVPRGANADAADAAASPARDEVGASPLDGAPVDSVPDTAPSAPSADAAPAIVTSVFEAATVLVPERLVPPVDDVNAGEAAVSLPPAVRVAPAPPPAAPVGGGTAGQSAAPREAQLASPESPPTSAAPPVSAAMGTEIPTAPRSDLGAVLWTLVARGDEAGAAVLARTLAAAGRPMSVPANVLSALQASRWFEADATPFGSDLAEIVAETTLADDVPTQLLATAAALVPVLVAPETNLRGWLIQGAAPLLAGLVGAVTRFADRGQRLDHRWIDGVVDAGEQKRQVEELQRSAKRIVDEAMHRRTKYQAATNVWREFFRRRLRPVLDRIIRGDDTVVADAEELVHRLGASATLSKELNTLDRQLRPGIGDEIDYGARDQLHAHVREVLDAIDGWARQTRTVLQLREMDWFPGQVAELRSSVGQMIGEALRYTDELVSSGSGILKACGAALRRSVADLAALLRIEGHTRPPATMPELYDMARDASGLDEAIANRWLWCPELPTDAADELARDPERLCDALLSVVPTLAACRSWIDRERYDEASRLATFVDGARETVNGALERSRILLRDGRDALRIAVEQGVLDGYVGEERARLLGIVERIDPSTATNIEQARRGLQRVHDEIDAARRKRLDAALARWGRLEERMRANGTAPELVATRRADLLAMHAQGDIRVVDETLALWEEGEGEDRHTRFDAVHAASLRTFRKDFLPAAEPSLQRGWGKLRQALMNNQLAIAGRTFPVGQKLHPVVAALDAWYALKRDGADVPDASVTGKVGTILLFMGFLASGDGVDRALERKRPGVRQVLGRYSDAGFSPVPQFGSQAHQDLRVVCVWERPGADTLNSIFADLPGSGPPVIVFYLGRLNDAQRVRLRALGRERPSVVFLDEMLLLFLAGERDARLRAFFACTLPYTWVNPYTPFQAGEVPPEMYFGRRALVLELQRPEGSCIVYGGRQLGKSALLREVARQFHDPSRKQYAIVIDVLGVGDAAHGREASVLWSLLRDRLKEAGAFETRRTNPEEIVKALREAFARDPKLRVLVLLDEADQLLDADARDRFAIVNELRRLMSETGRRFKVVLAGLHNVQRFQQIPNQPLAHFGRAIQVGPLEPRDAADLVRKPLASLGFEFESDSDVLRILSYTNYHPGLVQLFCHDLLIHLLSSSTTVAPPVRVSRQSVDLVYQRAEVRKGIRDRFDWTLALDPRYQAIAWAIIVEQAENPHHPETFAVRKLQTLAQFWWSAGFSATREDEFRGLLDEMCGLGVLAGGIEQGFRLRSPNVVRLMGDVESRLIELGQRPAPGVFDTEQLHREYADHAYAPLTLAQERQLLARRWGVALVFGTRALGGDTFVASLEALHNEEGADTIRVEQVPVDVDATALTDWLQDRPNLTTGMRVFVLRAPAHAERAAGLIEAARKYAERREQAVNVVGRVIVLFDGAATAAWVLEPFHDTIEGRLDAVLWLHKWTAAGIRPRLERHQLLGGPEQTNEVLRATAGWGQLLNWVFTHRGGGGIPQPEHDAYLAQLSVRLTRPDLTERRALVESIELEKGTRSWELLRLLHLLGGTGVARVDLTPELFDTELPGMLPEELDHMLTHLVRIGVVELRLEPGDGAPGAGLQRATVVVDPLVGAALFG